MAAREREERKGGRHYLEGVGCEGEGAVRLLVRVQHVVRRHVYGQIQAVEKGWLREERGGCAGVGWCRTVVRFCHRDAHAGGVRHHGDVDDLGQCEGRGARERRGGGRG